MIRILLLLLLIPVISTAQPAMPVYSMDLILKPEQAVTSSLWIGKTIDIMDKRLRLYGLSAGDFRLRDGGDKIEVKILATKDPEVIKAILTAAGEFRLLPVHKVDDVLLKQFYTALENAVVIVNGNKQNLSTYFQINDPPNKQLESTFRRYPPAVIGMARGEHKAIIDQFLHDPKIQALIPSNAKFSWGIKTSNIHVGMYDLYLTDNTPGGYLIGSEYINRVEIIRKPNIYGMVKDVLAIAFDDVGKQQLKQVTSANISRELVVLIDDKAISAPLVKGAIEAGLIEIPGAYNRQEAAFFGQLFRAKPLPVKLSIKENSRKIIKNPNSTLRPVNSGNAKMIWKQKQ